jgi:hypothetical protein
LEALLTASVADRRENRYATHGLRVNKKDLLPAWKLRWEKEKIAGWGLSEKVIARGTNSQIKQTLPPFFIFYFELR